MAKDKVSIEVSLLDRISSEYKAAIKTLTAADKNLLNSLNQVESKTKKVDKSTSDLSRTVKGLVVAFGSMATVHKMFGFVSSSLSLFNTQAEAVANVAQTIKSTGGAAGVTTDELKKMAAELQNVTKFGDETTLRGQAMLLTFKSIGKDIFPQATEAMLNLATKMRGDVQEASIQLGKALNDPITGITALRRVGITFSEDQEAVIKRMQETGDIAGAQKVVLAELESQFGGLARAAALAGTGPLEQFKNQLNDIKEGIGAELMPVVTQIIGEFKNFMTESRIQGIADGFQEWAIGAQSIAKWLAAVVRESKTLQAMFGNVKEGNFLKDPETNKQVKERVDRLIELRKELEGVNKDLKETNFLEKLWDNTASNKKTLLLMEEKQIREDLKKMGADTFAAENANLEKLSKGLGSIIAKKKEQIVVEKEQAKATQTFKPPGSAGPVKPADLPIFGPGGDQASENLAKFRAEQLKQEQTAKEAAKAVNQEILISMMTAKDQELAKLQSFEEEKRAILEKGGQDTLALDQYVSSQRKKIAELESQNIVEIQARRKEMLISGAQSLTGSLGNLARVMGDNELKAAQKAGATEEKLNEIRKKSFEKQKKFSLAQAIINTAQAVTSGLATKPFIPLGPIAAGIAAASGAVQVAAISAQKFQAGGIVGGNSFTGDQVPARLNSGEMILNRRQQSNLFKQINSGSGGNTINFEAPIINVAAGADMKSIRAAVSETYEEKIAKTAQLLNDVYLHEVIA